MGSRNGKLTDRIKKEENIHCILYRHLWEIHSDTKMIGKQAPGTTIIYYVAGFFSADINNAEKKAAVFVYTYHHCVVKFIKVGK